VTNEAIVAEFTLEGCRERERRLAKADIVALWGSWVPGELKGCGTSEHLEALFAKAKVS
jgi:hypothetical protein